MSTPINQQVAHILLEKQAVILQPDDPFTWASGIKSPIYLSLIHISEPTRRTQ